MLLFRSAVAYKPPLSSNFSPPRVLSLSVCLHVIYTLSRLFLSLLFCVLTLKCSVCVSSLSRTPLPPLLSSIRLCFLDFPTARVISNLRLGAVNLLPLCGITSALHPRAFPSSFSTYLHSASPPPQFLFLLVLFFLFFISAALRLCRPAVSSITRPSISSSIFLFFLCLPTCKHSRHLPPRLDSTLSRGGEIAERTE